MGYNHRQVVASLNHVFPNLPERAGQFESCQEIHIGEGITANDSHSLGDDELFDTVAAIESLIADGPQCGGEGQLFDRHLLECVVADGLKAFGQRQLPQLPASGERLVADGGHPIALAADAYCCRDAHLCELLIALVLNDGGLVTTSIIGVAQPVDHRLQQFALLDAGKHCPAANGLILCLGADGYIERGRKGHFVILLSLIIPHHRDKCVVADRRRILDVGTYRRELLAV